jgi:chemotaxis protein MotB
MQNVLSDAEVRSNVDAIVIQGHTDDRGSSAFNRDLSAKRANAVLDYLFAVNPTLEQDFGSYFASSAFSEFRPIDPGTEEAAFERNRRIEISVVLRDENVRRVIEDYTERLDPSLQPPPDAAPP